MLNGTGAAQIDGLTVLGQARQIERPDGVPIVLAAKSEMAKLVTVTGRDRRTFTGNGLDRV